MRMRMSVTLDDSIPLVEPDVSARAVTAADAAPLAALLLGAYRGTVDDGGEGPEEAAAEVAKLLAGGYGEFDFAASEIVVREGVVVSATLVTQFQGVPMVAFSMTVPAWQRRGLARAGLLRTLRRLRAAGRPRVDLAVTCANGPAVALYRSIGFREVPRGNRT